MKKLLAGVMSATLALGCLALPAEVTDKLDLGAVISASAETLTYGGFEYSVLDDGTVEITDYNGTDTVVSVPASINGKKVTGIGEYAFYNCTALTGVTVPSGVVDIGKFAFGYCKSLTTVSLPNTVKTIDDLAFCDCSKLASFTIPNGVTSLGHSTFDDCVLLAEITIPSTLETLLDTTFNGCSSLKTITVSANNQNFSSDGGVLYNKNKTMLIRYPSANTRTSYTVPSSVTSISSNAFRDCRNLTDLTISNSVQTIPYDAFTDCYSLKNITVSASNQYFSSADGILFNKDKSTLIRCPVGNPKNSYTIPSSVKKIEKSAFNFCVNLDSITIPTGLTTIGDNAFEDCKSLTSITIPNSVTQIGGYAFYNCDVLKSAKLSTNLSEIPHNMFGYCPKLSSITIPNGITKIGSSAFIHCYALTSITLPNSITSISFDTFLVCENLTSITIPDSITAIKEGAFKKCTNIKNVYYTGSKDKWNKISIESDNEYLTNATIHYNYDPDHTHTYTTTVVAPTYAAQGYTLHKCSSCGYSYKSNYTAKKTVPKAKISQSYTSTGKSFTLNWGKVSGATGYEVYKYDGKNSKWVLLKTVKGASTLSTTVSGFTPGSVIKFKVNAYAVENGKTYYGKTDDFLYAAALANAKISSSYTSTETSYTLNWGKVQGATGYKIYRYNGKSNKWVLAKTVRSASTLSTTVSGFTPGSVIKFKVNAYLTKGSKTYYGKTNDFLYAAALAPTKVNSSYTSTTTTAKISWNKVKGATGYKIYKYNAATKSWTVVKTVTSADTLSATLSGLKSKTSTKFKVNAYLTKGTKTYVGKSAATVTVKTK